VGLEMRIRSERQEARFETWDIRIETS
jgi:hypothetical protein